MNKQYLPFLLLLLIIPPHVFATQFHPFFWNCHENQGNYTADSPYQGSLNSLFNTLISTASDSLFGNASNTYDDQVNMLYNCRGDLTFQDCRDCVDQASKFAVIHCPVEKEAIVWFQECTLRYSNRIIFNQKEELPSAWGRSGINLSNPVQFGGVLVDVYEGLIMEAAYNESSKGYAIGEGDVLDNNNTVYCHAQCTPDILGVRCERCLREALGMMAGCCGVAFDGFQMYLPSCQVHYSIVEFLYGNSNGISAPTPPVNSSETPTSLPEGGARASMIKLDGEVIILGILMAISAFLSSEL